MPSNQGPLTWEAFRPAVRPPTIAGMTLSGCLATIRAAEVDAGIAIPMLDGGSVAQVEPLPEGASFSRAPSEITLTYAAATEDDSRIADLLGALCREAPQPAILWNVVSDYWRIGAAARTSWPLSRDSAPTPPDLHSGEIMAADGTRTALTLVSGTPGAGQIGVSGGTATTPDLSAQAGGLLCVRYYPIYMVAGVTRGSDYSEAGLLSFELTLREFLR